MSSPERRLQLHSNITLKFQHLTTGADRGLLADMTLQVQAYLSCCEKLLTARGRDGIVVKG